MFTAVNSIESFRFIDLFAGLGGFHVALAGLGGNAVFAAEWVPQLQSLYETNFGFRPHGDINSISPHDVPDHDVLTAGFPCQPFSKAGEQLGFEHTEQGQLFFAVEKILRVKRPRFFILENVPNILKHKNGATIHRIVESLAELGYAVQLAKLSPHEFGVPQIRERVYIVGSLDGLEKFIWPETSAEPTSILSVLEKATEDGRPLSESVLTCLQTWDDFLKASPAELQIPSFPIWAMEFGATYPFEDETPFALSEELGTKGLSAYRGSFGVSLEMSTVEKQMKVLPSHARRPQYRFPKWKMDFIRQNREFYASNKEWIDPILPRIQTFTSSFQKLEWNAKGEEKTIWKYVVQLRASGVRVKRPKTAPSLIAMTETQVPIIAWEKRYMTPKECARLQSLDKLVLPQQRSDAYKALGNAVNAHVVSKIAAALIDPGNEKSLSLAHEPRSQAVLDLATVA